ncbi:MAG: preprotein translocase subunit YajC [Oligoflexia bacterium]|nr:preprotein translocase subunit YajC [Oligoflexia bacterium]
MVFSIVLLNGVLPVSELFAGGLFNPGAANHAATSNNAAGAAGAATGAAANSPSPLASLLPFVLIFFVFYILLIRPQKKKAQQEEAMLSALNKGDEVVPRSGMSGTIQGLTEKVVTLEVAEGVRVKVLRGQIGGLASKVLEGKVVGAATSTAASSK